ncbi:hydrogenase iron-sulfur subunit [Thermodesulfobacteriota bacterium]
MTEEKKPILALFYCQRTPESNESIRHELEDKFKGSIRLFPLPCSGRLESLHLLRALEEFADAAYIITCPEGACRYFEGNRRAMKRVEMAQDILNVIGLEKERAGIVANDKNDLKTLSVLAEEIKKQTEQFGLSPVHAKSSMDKAHAA